MRAFLCLVLFSLVSSFARAQNQFGARLGVTASTVTGDFAAADDAAARYGFVGGFYLAFPLRYDFAVQAEVLYVQKGFQTDGATITGTGGVPITGTSATFELTTLDLPLLLTYTASLTSDLTVRPYAGPYVSFELSERVTADTDLGPISEEADSFVSTDIGFAVGFDLSLRFDTFEPTLGLRYARSAANVLEDEAIEASPVSDATAYNSVVAVFVALRL
jgi:hypothetical protein